jgi:hypothetical protein
MNTMNTGPYRIALPDLGGHSSRRGRDASRLSGSGFLWLVPILVAASAMWILLSSNDREPAETDTVNLTPAVAVAPVPTASATGGAMAAVPAYEPPTAAGEAIAPAETAPVDGLNISSQRWRRGGLGSKALMSFTIRNRNEYAVTDVAISCAFSRKDGSHLTDRIRTIHDVVKMRSRKAFADVHVGYVNINASKAKCAPIGARHG